MPTSEAGASQESENYFWTFRRTTISLYPEGRRQKWTSKLIILTRVINFWGARSLGRVVPPPPTFRAQTLKRVRWRTDRGRWPWSRPCRCPSLRTRISWICWRSRKRCSMISNNWTTANRSRYRQSTRTTMTATWSFILTIRIRKIHSSLMCNLRMSRGIWSLTGNRRRRSIPSNQESKR